LIAASPKSGINTMFNSGFFQGVHEFRDHVMAGISITRFGMRWRRTGWLGREDSNLRMAESKPSSFACCINAYSEKLSKFDRLPVNRLALFSEWG
jgi:hypothetical protein